MKIYDVFLFFQEEELLEIRLRYLYENVDLFIIVESNQSFEGSKREFKFEKIKKRFSKYLDKILYFKIDEFHSDYSSLKSFLSKSPDPNDNYILKILESHTHYDKKDLNWVLDAYSKECLHRFLPKFVRNEDLVLYSDLDEIPSLEFISNVKHKLTNSKDHSFFVAQQVEFQYFLNLLAPNLWYGTSGGLFSNLKFISINELRLTKKVSRQTILNGGFHFTSCGGDALLLRKIENWGHQEFNYSLLKNTAIKRVYSGYDAFGRNLKKNNKIVIFDNFALLDSKLKKILNSYQHLIINKPQDFSITDFFLLITVRVINIVNKFFLKIKRNL